MVGIKVECGNETGIVRYEWFYNGRDYVDVNRRWDVWLDLFCHSSQTGGYLVESAVKHNSGRKDGGQDVSTRSLWNFR